MDSKQNLRKALAAGAVTIAALGSVLLGGAGAAQAAASITISPGTYSAGQTVTVNFSGFPASAQVGVTICKAPVTTGTDECAKFGTPQYIFPVNADAAGAGSAQLVTVATLETQTMGTADCTVAGTCVFSVGTVDGSALASAPVSFTAPATSTPTPAPTASAAPTNTSGDLADTGPGDSLALGLGGLAVIAVGAWLIVDGRARRSGARV